MYVCKFNFAFNICNNVPNEYRQQWGEKTVNMVDTNFTCTIAHFIKLRSSAFVDWISVRFYETGCSWWGGHNVFSFTKTVFFKFHIVQKNVRAQRALPPGQLPCLILYFTPFEFHSAILQCYKNINKGPLSLSWRRGLVEELNGPTNKNEQSIFFHVLLNKRIKYLRIYLLLLFGCRMVKSITCI